MNGKVALSTASQQAIPWQKIGLCFFYLHYLCLLCCMQKHLDTKNMLLKQIQPRFEFIIKTNMNLYIFII